MRLFVNIIYFVLLLQITLPPANAETPRISRVKKHVIGCHRAGFFSIFISALNDLDWCNKRKKIPVINWKIPQCIYFQSSGYNGAKNPWEYYFLPVSDASYFLGDTIHMSYTSPDGKTLYPINKPWLVSLKERRRVKAEVIDKYIKLQPVVLKKIQDFYEEKIKGKYTVGIHLRGTDKNSEVKPVPILKIIAEANKHENCQYFIATDDKRLLDVAKETLNANIISYPSTISVDGLPVHEYASEKAKVGEEVLIEAYLLSMCDYFIHTVSNVSTAVLFLNPDQKSTLLRICGSKLKVQHTP